MEYRVATDADLESVWNKNIKAHPDDLRWVRWKEEYIFYNQSGMAKTFVAVSGRDVIAEVTLIFSPEAVPVKDKPCLCNGADTANFNAFRCDEEFRGQGHISKLVKLAEAYAKEHDIKKITIGVEAKETQNISIYFHFGYLTFEMFEVEPDGSLVLYYSKNLD